MQDVAARQDATYVLGHTDDELQRLIRQSQFFDDLTRSALSQAGLGKGMRVLDVGCGAGDVSFLAAGMVRPQGAVIGIDKSAEAVALATARANAAGLSNVQFLTRDAVDLVLEQPVDALIGRLVLMYFADSATVLRRLVTFVRPGGVVVFQEIDMDGAKSEPESPVFATAVQRIVRAFARAGIEARTGLRLHQIFQEAGLAAPTMVLGARVESGPESPIYDQVAQVTRSLLPVMETTGLATPEEIDIDTLADRMRNEAVALGATLVSPSLISACTRKGA